MRSTIFLAALSVAAAAPDTIQDTIKAIPSCSYSSLGRALDKFSCAVNPVTDQTLGCAYANCKAIIDDIVSTVADKTCVITFNDNFGLFCNSYSLFATDGSQVSAGVSALQAELISSTGAGSASASGIVASSAPVAPQSSSAAAPTNSVVVSTQSGPSAQWPHSEALRPLW